MPTPADPILWTVLERVQTTLAAIVAGANYFYTPHKVYIVRNADDDRLFDSTQGNLAGGDPATIYAVRRNAALTARHATGDNATGDRLETTVEVGVLVSRQHVPAAATDDPTEAEVIERMRADVIRALTFVDPALGVLDADDTATEGVEDDVWDEPPDGWIALELTFRVRYQFPSSRP
jgi:hypothetical protein